MNENLLNQTINDLNTGEDQVVLEPNNINRNSFSGTFRISPPTEGPLSTTDRAVDTIGLEAALKMYHELSVV